MSNLILMQESIPAAKLAADAINAIMQGDIDPIKAHINVSRMEQAIKIYKADKNVRDITLRELSKYTDHCKGYAFGDCVLQEKEVGQKYDYTACGDSTREKMIAELEALSQRIKEREQMLKALPLSGLADPETGEMLFPPAKSSTTTITTTFKK
ncbi:MAG: hypothetical protein RRY23_06100 [Alistipes sp.]